jgi:hypothetical protein
MEHARAIKDPPPSISEVNDIDSSHHGDQYSEEGSSYHGDDGFDGAAATAPQRSLLLGAKTASKAFKKDQKLVRGARVTVMLVLLTSAVTVATLAYVLLSMNEEKSFQDQVRQKG